MLFKRARVPILAFAVALAAAAAWVAYESRGLRVAGALVALVSVALAVRAAWAGRRSDHRLDDPSVSTLVFPPESKFR